MQNKKWWLQISKVSSQVSITILSTLFMLSNLQISTYEQLPENVYFSLIEHKIFLVFLCLSLEYSCYLAICELSLTESLGKTLLSLDLAILESRQCLPVLDQVFLLDEVQNFTITRSLLRQIAAFGKRYSLGFILKKKTSKTHSIQ